MPAEVSSFHPVGTLTVGIEKGYPPPLMVKRFSLMTSSPESEVN
jgi:hypothetical protein